MKYSYSYFLKDNRQTSRKDGCMTIIGVHFTTDTCTVINPDRKRYEVPIPVLISDMINGLGHINDASKLRYWSGWNKNFTMAGNDNTSKYIPIAR